MKKLLLLLIVLIFLAVSCGDSKKAENDSDILPDDDTATTDEDETDYEEPDEDADYVEDDPCKPNPCKDVKHSTGECGTYQLSGKKYYLCICEDGYIWNWENSCRAICDENNECKYKEHSSGECTARESLIGDDAYCGCIDGYYWDDDRYKCTSSSEEKEECADFQNPDSDGI